MEAKIKWHPITEKPEVNHGWFLIAMQPNNHKVCNSKDINDWRDSFAVHRGWYNASSIGNWYYIDNVAKDSLPAEDLITHWAEMPEVPKV